MLLNLLDGSILQWGVGHDLLCQTLLVVMVIVMMLILVCQ